MAEVSTMRTANSEQRLTFCTLFDIHNEHLTKDVGLIPYGMHKYEGYDAFMATYLNDDYPNLKYVPGLRIEEVPKVSGDWVKDSCGWLRKNAKRIDVLNLYHTVERSFRHAVIYKLHNPKGKIYLKFDGWTRPFRFRVWNNIKPRILMRLCKVVSTEFQENTERLSRQWRRPVIFIPNPFNPNEIAEFKPFSERSNTILTVGRLGTRQKATEILLEAFAKISSQIPDWSLKLAGPITEHGILDDFTTSHPELKDRVIFTGPITDREAMTELYREAKIFAFPSRFEGCSLAIAEAMIHGDFVNASNILPNELITEHFRFALGSEVDDVDGLAGNLLYSCTHEKEIERFAIEGRESAMRRCDLRAISKTLCENLK